MTRMIQMARARLASLRLARRGGSQSDEQGDEQGITTAEYSVGTAAGAGLAGVLYAMVTGGFGDKLLTTLFDHVLSLLGVG